RVDIDEDLLGRPALDLVFELLHLGALAPDDDPRPRVVDRDAGAVRGPLDVDARDSRVIQRRLDEAADLDILVQEGRVTLRREPARAPRARRSQTKPERMCLLPHGSLLATAVARAARLATCVSSESSTVRWLVRCLMKYARP